MSLPIGDWQFWVVTLAALLAAWYLLREVIPSPLRRTTKKKPGKRADLTIGGRTPPR
jgi:hypothetical protein